MFKSNLNQGKSINTVRKEIGTLKEEEIENKAKKVLLFIIYLNNKIDRLKRKQSYKNGIIVNDFYKINNFQKSYNNLVDIEDIMECKIIESDKSIDMSSVMEPDINLLEYTFFNIVNDLYIDHVKQLEIMPPVNISKLLEGQIPDINIKESFKLLENIFKTIKVLNKIDGYLKEKRRGVNNES